MPPIKHISKEMLRTSAWESYDTYSVSINKKQTTKTAHPGGSEKYWIHNDSTI